MGKREVSGAQAWIALAAAFICANRGTSFAGDFGLKEIAGYGNELRIPASLVVLLVSAAAVALFILGLGARVKKKKKAVEIPDFSYDATETVRIDVHGQVLGMQEEDEGTVVVYPGCFKVTKGPADLNGEKFYITSLMTKIGREESTVDKGRGWLIFPRSCTTVSRYQADLIYDNGRYYVHHRSMTTETKVNGVPVNSKEPREVAANDVISFGGIDLTYVRDEVAGAGVAQ